MNKQAIKNFIVEKIIETYPDVGDEEWKITVIYDCVIGYTVYYTARFFSQDCWHMADIEINCVINTVEISVSKIVPVVDYSFDLPVELRGDSNDD